MNNIDRKAQWDALLKGDGLPFIKDGICVNDGTYKCELGFACDACPFNAELKRNEGIKIDGDHTTIEELCNMIKEMEGFFDGDEFAVKNILGLGDINE